MDELSMSPVGEMRYKKDANEYYYLDMRCVALSNSSNVVELTNWSFGAFAERVDYVPISHSIHTYTPTPYTLHPFSVPGLATWSFSANISFP